jgi:hypothetical protein
MTKSKLDSNFYISDSKIQGKGVFTNRSYDKDESIDVGIRFFLGVVPYVTSSFGSMINHDWSPNTYLEYDKKAHNYVIKCKKALGSDTEITLNYENTPWYIMGPNPKWK